MGILLPASVVGRHADGTVADLLEQGVAKARPVPGPSGRERPAHAGLRGGRGPGLPVHPGGRGGTRRIRGRRGARRSRHRCGDPRHLGQGSAPRACSTRDFPSSPSS